LKKDGVDRKPRYERTKKRTSRSLPRGRSWARCKTGVAVGSRPLAALMQHPQSRKKGMVIEGKPAGTKEGKQSFNTGVRSLERSRLEWFNRQMGIHPPQGTELWQMGGGRAGAGNEPRHRIEEKSSKNQRKRKLKNKVLTRKTHKKEIIRPQTGR